MWLVLIKRIAELAVESHADGMLFGFQSEVWGLSECKRRSGTSFSFWWRLYNAILHQTSCTETPGLYGSGCAPPLNSSDELTFHRPQPTLLLCSRKWKCLFENEKQLRTPPRRGSLRSLYGRSVPERIQKGTFQVDWRLLINKLLDERQKWILCDMSDA